MEKIKTAIIGCGRMGRLHAEVIRANPKMELLALCDSNPDAATSSTATGVPFYASFSALLAAGHQPRLVSIASPNGMHATHAIEALEAGCHVIIEKPMALHSAHCKEILELAARRQLHVFCIMQNRFAAPARWLKNLADNQLLGEPFFAQVNCFWNRDERYYTGLNWHGDKELDGGPLFTQFSHFVDTLYWLLGDIRPLHSRFGNFTHEGRIGFEDTGTVSFAFGKRGMGSFNYSTSAAGQNAETSFTLLTSNASIRIEGQYFDKITHCVFSGEPPMAAEAAAGNQPNHYAVFDNVADVLKGTARPVTDGYDGLCVVDIIERMYAAGQ